MRIRIPFELNTSWLVEALVKKGYKISYVSTNEVISQREPYHLHFFITETRKSSLVSEYNPEIKPKMLEREWGEIWTLYNRVKEDVKKEMDLRRKEVRLGIL